MQMTKVSPNTILTMVSNDPTLIQKVDMFAAGTAITEFSLYDVSPAIVAAEKITDGKFLVDPAATWTVGAGWEWIEASSWMHRAAAAGVAALVFNATEAANDIYYLTYDIVVTAGEVVTTVGGVAVATETTSGSKAYMVKATGAGDLTFTPNDAFHGTLTNVTMKKVGDASSINWTGAISGNITDSKHDNPVQPMRFKYGCYALLTGANSIGRVWQA